MRRPQAVPVSGETDAPGVMRLQELTSRRGGVPEGEAQEKEQEEGPSHEKQVMRAPGDAVPAADTNAVPAGPQPADPLTGGKAAGPTGSTTITVTHTTRALSAPNLSQLWDVMTNSGARESASVLPQLKPDPQYEYDAGNNVTKAVLSVSETKEMPQWAERPKQCPPIAAEWDRFLGVLDAHENNHLAIDKKHFTDLHTRLIGKEQSVAWKMVDDEIAAADKENEAYDASSNHGVNEGANINTAVQCAPEKVKSTLNDAGPTSDPTSDAPTTMQAKLTVSVPGDPAEMEADQVADRVMRAEAPTVQRQCAGPGACDCPDCRREQQERTARAGADGEVSHDAGALMDGIVGRGGGRPLDPATRAFMEPRFGHDFSRVRVHADERASRSAEAVAARAYAVGGDLVFRQGEYAPGTADGDRLLAHELTHTIQQGAAQRQVMREGDDNPNSDANQRKLIDKALASKSPGDVHDINQFRLTLASEAERFLLLDILLNHNSFVGPIDATYIQAIWNSFGKNLATMLDDPGKFALWTQCDAHTLVNLNGISELTALKEQFKADILAKVRGYLSQNRVWADTEIKRLGLDNLAAPATADQTKERREMQEAAKKLQPALDTKRKLEDIILGRHLQATASLLRGEPVRFGDSIDQEPTMAEREAGAPTWQQVKAQHTPLVAVIQGVTDKYPTLYALIKDDKVVDFENGKDEASLRKTMSDSMHNVLTNIDKTDAELSGTGNNLLLELQPIHEQLYKESPTWSKPFAQSVARKTTDQYKNDKFWEQLGLNTLGAALFVFATVATSGAAIAMVAAGTGISAAQATQSWLDYEKMSAASQTNLSDKTALIRQSDVTSALIDAVLATAAAFLDAYAATKELQALGEGADAATKAAAEAKANDAQGRLAGAEGQEAKQIADLEEVKASAPVGNGHDVNVSGRGIDRCSPPPCPLIGNFWEAETKRHPAFKSRLERLEDDARRARTDPGRLAQDAAAADRGLQDLTEMEIDMSLSGVKADSPKLTDMKQPPQARADIANRVLTDEEMQETLKRAEELKTEGKLRPDWKYEPPSAPGFVVDPDVAKEAMELIGTRLSENAAVAECWQKAVDGALAGKTLSPENYADIYKSAQGRLWRLVEKNDAAKEFFKKHGFVVEGGISPALEVDGVARPEISLGLDHMQPKATGDNWQHALDADQIQLLMQADNTKLSHLEKKDPSLRR